jgi:hypothetical protein
MAGCVPVDVYFADLLDTSLPPPATRAAHHLFSPCRGCGFQGYHHKMPSAAQPTLAFWAASRKKVMKALGWTSVRRWRRCACLAGVVAVVQQAGLHINEGYGTTENLRLHITEPGGQ